MNFSRGQTGTKVRCESRLFSQGKAPEFTKTGEIHELFFLVLSLVWFAGTNPDNRGAQRSPRPSVEIFFSKGFLDASAGVS